MGPDAAVTGRPEGRPLPEHAELRVDVEQRFASGVVVAPVLDVELAPGTILVLFGPSGAGKTTMLRQVAGLERPDRGRIQFGGDTWCDMSCGEWRSPQERRIGMVFQQPALFPHLSVRDNIEYGLSTLVAAERRQRSGELIRLLAIPELADRLPRALSGGEAQRVAVARALAPKPGLVLLDEPFASLDVPARARLRREVRSLMQRSGTPAVLVTHDRTEALALGDQIAVATGGRIRQVGPIADVFSRPADADVAASLGVEAVLPGRIVDAREGLLSVQVGDTVIHVAEREPTAVGSNVYACIRAEDVTLETQSPAHASTRNHLAARVIAIAAEGPIDRVSLDCGFALDALITRRAREELRLAVGAPITAAIKATSVHLVPRI
jgi:molybdate transport system ATP-binding protein